MYNGIEYEESLGLNLYEMSFRQYDPAIGRFTSIDPVTHFQQSTYAAFDNNPVYWTDPSGTTSVQDLVDQASNHPGVTFNSNGDGTFTGDGVTIGEKQDTPKEGQSQSVSEWHGNVAISKTKYYHAGGVDGSKSGWYEGNEYFEKFRTTIRRIGQGEASIAVLGSFNFTDDVLIAMTAWAVEAYEQYGGEKRIANGAATPLYFTSPFFAPGIGFRFAQMSNTSKFAFWSGTGTQQAAINAGYRVLGQTRAGQNLAALTADMAYAPGTQAYNFWGRLSAALAGKVPKGGTANVFLTREAVNNTNSIWNVFEKPVLLQNKVKIKYNWVD